MPVEVDKFPTIRDRARYRIQSVDFGTFLERRGVTVILRPLKTTSDNQEVSNLRRIVVFILP
jgi:hypothetical protein